MMTLSQLLVAIPLTVIGSVLFAAGVVLLVRALLRTAPATVGALDQDQRAVLRFTTRDGQPVELRVPAPPAAINQASRSLCSMTLTIHRSLRLSRRCACGRCQPCWRCWGWGGASWLLRPRRCRALSEQMLPVTRTKTTRGSALLCHDSHRRRLSRSIGEPLSDFDEAMLIQQRLDPSAHS